MTIVALPVMVPPGAPRRAPRDWQLWAISLAAILALHAAGLMALLSWRIPLHEVVLPSDAVMIDLAPLAVPPPPPEEPPPPEVEIPPPPEPPPLVEPELVLPKIVPPPPKKPPPPRPIPPRPAVQMAPPAEPVPPAPVVAPPAAPPLAPVDPLAAYAARLVAELQRHQRYPITSRQRHEEGTVMMRFTLDRNGAVLQMRVERGSGHDLLDQEAQAMIRRTDPLPAPPPEIQAPLELSLPVRFTLR